MNVPVSGVDFSSVFDLTVRHQESGVAYVLWTFKRSNETVIYQEKVPGKSADKQSCFLDVTKCDCTPAGDCFYFNQSYAVSNCRMMVEKDSLKTENITVIAYVTNMAGLVISLSWTKRDITDLNGTKAYFPPQNVNVSLITSNSAKVSWTFPPSCFQRTGLWVIVNEKKDPVHKDATEYSLTGLDPQTVYTIHMVTGYEGEQMSDSESVTFQTGLFPYSELSKSELLDRLKGGYRMEQPGHCDDFHYQLMMKCWQDGPAERPTFQTIHSSLSTNRTGVCVFNNADIVVCGVDTGDSNA